jgi:hypothetical protein
MLYRLQTLRWFILVGLLASGCNSPYAEFGDEQKVYVCGQNGDAIVTDRSCDSRSDNYLRLLDGGLTGGMALFVDLCNAYAVTVFGDFEVVGRPPFEHQILGWSQYAVQRDSLRREYNRSECRHVYTE